MLLKIIIVAVNMWLVKLVFAEVETLAVMKSFEKFSLSGTWTAINSNGSISIKSNVPGSIYTDLMRENVIGNPYFRQNDIAFRWVAHENWTFKRNFDVECNLLQKKRILLIAEGLDTISNVYLNGEQLGSSENMFVQYSFDIKSLLQTKNLIEVAFESPIEYAKKQHEEQVLNYVIPPTCPPPVQNGDCHVNYIRKTQSSFSWDWGPSFPTQGIWKPLSIIGFDTILIKDITVATNAWNPISFRNITVSIFMETASSEPIMGLLQIMLNGTMLLNSTITVNPDANLFSNMTFQVHIPSSLDIQLWWPNGLGSQAIYSLNISFLSKNENCHKAINFGFRTIELIQEPVENSTGLSFYFKVNGVPFFAKGSNWIPADSFLERVTSDYTEYLLKSAKEGNMNMLRVWGGGVYESDEFYAAADRLGILIWQDLMFACALYPVNDKFLHSVSVEVTQQVRRLQHHPSLLLWAGNNENEQSIAGTWWPAVKTYLTQYKADYVKLYIETIAPIVAAEDPTRHFLSSSPSNGPKTAEEGWISSNPQDTHYGDVHFYTYTGDEWNSNTFPRARFVSEYGFQSYPSFESLAQVSLPNDWIYPLGPFMKHRQHHMFGDLEISRMISKHFTLPVNTCGVQAFKDILYLSQIVQAVAIKTETEKYRRSQSEIIDSEGNTMGALYWQLNDIWPAPSWASIEYGGKWKMLHYYAKKFFTPLLVSSYKDNNTVFASIVSDLPTPQNDLVLNLEVYHWSDLTPAYAENLTVDQPAKFSHVVYKEKITGSNGLLEKGNCIGPEYCLVYFRLISNQEVVSTNFVFLTEPKFAIGMTRPILNINTSGPFVSENSEFSFNITLSTTDIAPFIWLDVYTMNGSFSDNGFLMVYPSVNVMFYSRSNCTLEDVDKNLHVRSLLDTCVDDFHNANEVK